jgi:glycosyltransferase involved in cell wall biosynthesis
MKVCIAIPGVFHYKNYVELLSASGILDSFIYSHKLSTVFGPNSRNIYIKEYLVQAHGRIFQGAYTDIFFPFYHDIWAQHASKFLHNPNILHIPLHGAAIPLAKKIRYQGGVVLGEALNSHPKSRNEILEKEDHLLFGRVRSPQRKIMSRQLEEIGQTHYILAPSRWVKDSYVSQGYDADKIFVLPYAGNNSNFPLKTKYEVNSRLRLIVVAGVTPRKGHHKLLEAIALTGLSITVIFAGSIDTEFAKILKKRWPKLLIEFLGKVSHLELGNLLTSCDIFCLPSLEEGLAVSICEAMAVGLPVIASDQSGAGELIENGKNGFLYDCHAICSLCKIILDLSNNEGLRRSIGQNAQLHMQLKNNWGLYAEKLAEIYQEIAT